MPAASLADTITRTSSFDYQTGSGILIKEVVEPTDSSLCLVTSYGLDAYGHQTSTTTRNCSGATTSVPGGQTEAAAPAAPAAFASRTTNQTYSSDQRFPYTTTNALGQTESKTFDGRFGTVTSLTGPNNLTTTWAYDPFGRKVAEKRADGTGTRWDYAYCTSVAGAGGIACPTVAGAVGAYAITTTPLQAPVDINAPSAATASGPYVRAYYDTLGREIRNETQGFDGSGSSQLIYQDTQYDALGRVSQKSRPYFSGAGTVYWVTYSTDTLNRVVQVVETTAAGVAVTSTTTYNGLVTTVTDALQHSTTETRNVQGQVITVTDHSGGSLSREYDAVNNLVRTTDARGNVTSLVYDTRGRKTALYDPDLGIWNYAYNAAGELVRQTNAKQQVSTMAYDLLGRMTSRTEPDLTSTWFYEVYADGSTCTKGVGKLCEARTDNGYARKTTYDSLGRVSSTTSTVGTPFTSSITYNATTGRIDTQTYPTGLQLRSNFTALGYLRSVTDLRNGTAVWTASSFNAEGRILQYTYGNGLVTTNDYYADARLNSTRAGPSGSVQTLSHTYDTAGNLTTRSDLLTGVSASYSYDALNRLVSESRSGGSVNPAQAIAWAYDAIGNMTQRTEGGVTNVYNYPASGSGSLRPHAVASVSGSINGYVAPQYSYDANGNLISGAGRTVAWNSFDKAQSITQASTRLDYLYDADHERAQESYYLNGSLQRRTVYLNPAAGAGLFYEEESGVAGTRRKHYITAGGATVAMIVCTATPCTTVANTSTQYWHTDHLGSVSVVTNEAGAVVERMAYEPFGKRRNSNGTTDPNGTLAAVNTDRGYTGHEHLQEVGLINMNGRVFDPGLGRFMSADPLIQNPMALQSYNRYSYVWNSPLNGTDPTGYSKLSTAWHRVWHNDTFQAIVTIAIAAYTGNYGYAAAYTGARTYYETGSAGQGLKAAAISYGMSYAFAQVGSSFPGDLENTFAHAAVGCVSAAASGGNCGAGALSAGAAAAFTNYGRSSMKGWTLTEKVVAHAIIGGTASALGGGKFSNGAITGAFGYLFNECQHTRMCGSDSTSVRVTGNRVVGDLAHVEIEISGGYDFVVLEARPSLTNGRLVDTSNGPNWGSAFSYELTPPAGETTSSIGLKLQAAAGLYKNDLWYGLPGGRGSAGRVMDYGYNSNSYVGGLIERVLPGSGIRWGIEAAAQARGFRVPGMEKPIPLGGPR